MIDTIGHIESDCLDWERAFVGLFDSLHLPFNVISKMISFLP